MPAVFLVSDTHFGHAGVCRFTHPDDPEVKLRPWDDPDEMDEEMIRRWNDTVRPSDKVYHLGDVVINRKALKTLARLNGDKVLIRGNHDIFRDDEYREYFRELRAYHVVKKARGVDAKTGTVLYSTEIDPRYHCVCVEQTDFAPILFEDAIKRIEAEGGVVGFRSGNGPTM